jgi:hypothetical protein
VCTFAKGGGVCPTRRRSHPPKVPGDVPSPTRVTLEAAAATRAAGGSIARLFGGGGGSGGKVGVVGVERVGNIYIRTTGATHRARGTFVSVSAARGLGVCCDVDGRL